VWLWLDVEECLISRYGSSRRTHGTELQMQSHDSNVFNPDKSRIATRDVVGVILLRLVEVKFAA
jgi:hypothetical protein